MSWIKIKKCFKKKFYNKTKWQRLQLKEFMNLKNL